MIKKRLKSAKIFSLDVISAPKERLLVFLGEAIKGGKRLFLVTLNPEFVIASKKDPRFLEVLQKADIAFPDGIGLIWAREVGGEKGFFKRVRKGFRVGLKVLKGELVDQVISGTDLMLDLCSLAAKNSWPVYFLGAEPGVAKRTLRALKNRYPGLKGWAVSGPELSSEKNEKNTPGVKSADIPGVDWQKWTKKINQKKPTFLFVALGMKKQERFIWENWGRLKVNLAMGVGGAFDYLSGEVKRAPIACRRLGLEWIYRLFRQPWRIKRQLALLKFIWLVLKVGQI